MFCVVCVCCVSPLHCMHVFLQRILLLLCQRLPLHRGPGIIYHMIYSADVVLCHLRGLLWLLLVVGVVLLRPVDVLSAQGYAKVHIYGGRRPVCTPACGCGAHRWRRKLSRRSYFRCLVPRTTREWLQSDGAFFFCGCGHCHSQKRLPHHVRLAIPRAPTPPTTPHFLWFPPLRIAQTDA